MLIEEGSSMARTHSWVAGFIVALPLAYPSVPFYWGGFIVFISMLFYAKTRLSLRIIFLVLCAMIVALASNLRGLSGFPIGHPQILFTTLYFLFFFFGYLVPSADHFFRGYMFSITMLAISVLIAASFAAPWGAGLLMFSVPDYRLWGAQYFPDWPNFLAFMLALGSLICVLLYRKYILGFLCMAAAILTTSRTPLIAVFIWFFYVAVSARARLLLVPIVFGIGGAAFYVILEGYGSSEFIARLLVFSDREEVYGSAWRLFLESPILGHGGVLLDDSVGNLGAASFHNSYLDILVRHGLLGFLFFLILIAPRIDRYRGGASGALLALAGFFIASSFFQNFLKHPHLIMIYSVLLSCFIREDESFK